MITRVSVVLPEPLGPISATRTPVGRSRSTPASASSLPYRLRTEESSTRMEDLLGSPRRHPRRSVDQERSRSPQRQQRARRVDDTERGSAPEEGEGGMARDQLLGGGARFVRHVAATIAVEIVAGVVAEEVAAPVGL